MPTVTRALLAGLALLAVGGPVAAQPKARVAAARVGLPPGPRATDRDDTGRATHVGKYGAWAPVYVEVEILSPVDTPAELVVEAPDADDVTTVLAVPVNLNAPAGTLLLPRQLGPMPYVRPTLASGEITIFVRQKDGPALSDPFRIRYLRAHDPSAYIVLGVNGSLAGFDLPRSATANQSGTPGSPDDPNGPLRGGRVVLATMPDVDSLPDQWIGYDAADLVVLTTGRDGTGEFLARLFGDRGSPADKARGRALLEWVRRGGRLVVSAGANAADVAALPGEFPRLLPARMNPDPRKASRAAADLPLSWAARESSQAGVLRQLLAAKSGTFPVAVLARKSDPPGRVVIPAQPSPAEEQEPTAVQAAHGLGRVTLIGFDLDRGPFTDLPAEKRADFWDWVLREGGASRASAEPERRAGSNEDEDELAHALRTHTDTFDGVPVVSFGWVALLVALYILLIGPVEYYFLKRVLKRLELTWVTFPVIVVTVSVAAYFTAYAVKGRDLRVNKVDVLEVVAGTDPQTGRPTGRAYGNTWVTVFSPRIDAYTVGVTPGEGIGAAGDRGTSTVSWVGAPRAGRAGLVRRKYAFHVDEGTGAVADGVVGAPVQVWSTKSFGASYAVDLDPARPAVESKLTHPPGNPNAVVGTFVNRLPLPDLTDCVAFYGGKAFPLGAVPADSEVRLLLDPAGTREPLATAWLQTEAQLGLVVGKGGSAAGGPPGTPTRGAAQPTTRGPANTLPLWGFLFHEAALRPDEGVFPRNASLRRLDQSWRLNPAYRDEVIVVGRVLPPVGPAEEALNGGSSPTRLWLRGLPGDGDRTPVPGVGRQETYVRLYLRVRPAGSGP